MTIEPEYVLQVLMGILLGVIGFMLKQALNRLDKLSIGQENNRGRLIRIETRLGITDFTPNGDME